MAAVNQQQFVNFLRSLNIDLSEFPDLSFDNICEEPSLQPFLSWLCSSFDSGNILVDEEIDKLPLVTVSQILSNSCEFIHFSL